MKIQRLLLPFVLSILSLPLLALSCMALFCAPAFADDVPDALRPPKGSQFAIVVFEDLQCPSCGQKAPLLEQASRTYKIPLVQHDFPLRMHNWSMDAAIMARYFDTHSKDIGNEYRADVFAHQSEITPQTLRGFSEKFAADHKMSIPFIVDPEGKFAALIRADQELGKTLHIEHTPTIWIVSNKHTAKPYVEVTDTNQLYVMIDAMKKD